MIVKFNIFKMKIDKLLIWFNNKSTSTLTHLNYLTYLISLSKTKIDVHRLS